jgi:hypothetical protein
MPPLPSIRCSIPFEPARPTVPPAPFAVALIVLAIAPSSLPSRHKARSPPAKLCPPLPLLTAARCSCPFAPCCFIRIWRRELTGSGVSGDDRSNDGDDDDTAALAVRNCCALSGRGGVCGAFLARSSASRTALSTASGEMT